MRLARYFAFGQLEIRWSFGTSLHNIRLVYIPAFTKYAVSSHFPLVLIWAPESLTSLFALFTVHEVFLLKPSFFFSSLFCNVGGCSFLNKFSYFHGACPRPEKSLFVP